MVALYTLEKYKSRERDAWLPRLRITRVLLVFYILGLVSLLADIVYEGGRSVSGAYLKELNSPPEGVALIGLGEFAGYILRLVSAYLATVYQSSSVIWGFTIAGYAITALSIPMLAFAPTWGFAVSLYLLDRVGKGLRAPTRDVVLAEVSEGMGLGKGFGVHELMDQLGAFLGPLIVATVIAYWGYKEAFMILFIPGLAAVSFIVFAYRLYPSLRSVSVKTSKMGLRGLDASFWVYTLASCFLALGFMHWTVVSYYLKAYNIANDYEIGLVYAVAMIVDALVAVPLGAVFDKVGLSVLTVAPVLSLLFLLNLLSLPRNYVMLLAIPWGIVMCAEESIMRASIAKIVEPAKRPIAYGTYSVLFGLFWAAGTFAYSMVLDKVYLLIALGLSWNSASLALFVALTKFRRPR